MKFTINSGSIMGAQKVILYGPEGIGKTSLARQFPGAVYIDTEDSTKQYAVQRITLPDGSARPSSWAMLTDMVKAVRDGAISGVGTLVMDSLDWAEALCIEYVCGKYQKTGIEDFGYGKGYTYVEEEFGKLLNLLSEVTARNIHVVCTAHAQLRRVELPEETGAYDHWEMKLERRDAALAKEWADMVLFLNYKTIVSKGKSPMEKAKATGGKRVMHSVHTPWWDAKNRHGLPEEMPLAYESIAHLFTGTPAAAPAGPAGSATPKPPEPPRAVEGPSAIKEPPSPPDSPQRENSAFTELPSSDGCDLPFPTAETANPAPPGNELPACVPKSLADLMHAEGMTVPDLQAVIYRAKCYPADTPLENMAPEFFDYLVSIWPQAVKMHKDIKGGN